MNTQANNAVTLVQESEYWFPYHYVSRMPSDGFRQHFVDTWGVNYISTIEFLLERLAALDIESLIDIGCGDGRLTREIALGLRPSKLLGVDYSRRAISLAQAMNQDLRNLSFVRADITAPHELGVFDVAVLMEVFEHIPLDMAMGFIEGVRRLVKPGGRLLLTVPHKNKSLEYKHFQHFSLKSISYYLQDYFDIVDIMPFEKRGLGRSVMNALLSNRFFVLNNRKALQYLYVWHKNRLFLCKNEDECQRIYVEAIAK